MDLLEGLNHEQVAAVRHDQGPLLVIAGAGTGKTQVITRRIAYLIQTEKAKPDEILALTFTDKAAREMEERVDQLLPYGLFGVNITTFNAFGDKLLREFGLHGGMGVSLQLINRTQQVLLLREHFDELELDYFATKGNPAGLFGVWLDYFSSLRNELIGPSDYLGFARNYLKSATEPADKLEAIKHLELARAYDGYTRIKVRQGLIDYDDQVYESLKLLERRPNVAADLQRRYKYMLVDEFQDTNLVQNHLLEILATTKGNLMVVGDDDQSIYKFRGAAISNILEFTERFNGAKRIILTNNYRSNQLILDASYRLIQHNNPDRLEVKYDIDKHLLAQNPNNGEVLVRAFHNLSEETESLAIDVAARLDRGQDPAEIAILVRTRRQMTLLAPALERHDVPFAITSAQKLMQQPEVQKVLYALECVVDPAAGGSLYHLLESDWFNVDIASLSQAATSARRLNQPLGEYLEASNQAPEGYSEYAQAMENWRDYTKTHLASETAYYLMKSSGMLDRLEKQADTDPQVPAIFKNLERFLQSIKDYQEISDDRSVAGFMASLGDLRQLADTDAYVEPDLAPGEVRLMTIHQSKGLEFETVYLFDMNRTAFPGAKKRVPLSVPEELISEVLPEGDWHLQEERRLAYVAMTRAKQDLVMSFSTDHGTKLMRKPSPFIAEAIGADPVAPEETTQTQLAALERFAPTKPTGVMAENKLIDESGWLNLTPHMIDDYDTCPYNFRYKYLLEVPEAPSEAAMYGTVLHKAINQYYLLRKDGPVDLATLKSLIDELWVGEGFVSAEHERKRHQLAHATIENFVQRESNGLELVASEESFELPFAEEKVRVRGRIDAVLKGADGSIEIRDFKTADVETQDKAESKAKTSLQLALYALAWQQTRGKAPDRVVLDYVNTGQLGVATKTAKQLDLVREKVLKVAAGIRAGEYPRGNCTFCTHRPLAADVIIEVGDNE